MLESEKRTEIVNDIFKRLCSGQDFLDIVIYDSNDSIFRELKELIKKVEWNKTIKLSRNYLKIGNKFVSRCGNPYILRGRTIDAIYIVKNGHFDMAYIYPMTYSISRNKNIFDYRKLK